MTMKYDAMMRPEDLEAVDNTIYEPKREELIARTLVNVKSDVPDGAETYSYDVMTRTGVAKILASGADDVPLVDADMRRHTVHIYSIAAAFRVSMQELRQARMANQPIEATKAATARRAVAEKENRLAWSGDETYNILGFTNAEGIQTSALDQNEAGDSTQWADKSGKEIVADLRQARSKVNRLPGHNADTLVVTPDALEELEKEYNQYTGQTVRQYIQNQGWFSTIQSTSDLEEQGDSDEDCFLVFDSSTEVVQLLVPMDLTRHEQEYKYPNYKVPVEERCGGVVIRYPMAIVRGDGV
ncbi:hypothetical protein J2S78_002065 [Salibacterium salarium]|uniref:DUF2184 domain-containing protein n=1 Tax=Salibacterium salarium TaxID=284579 RepID=UPI00278A661C|nr:family 1 encapsulin nanocompartment shell protein [Salibacterium salarium]MDQ0299645.1 hypothetical protein [Salibacterium salarium]